MKAEFLLAFTQVTDNRFKRDCLKRFSNPVFFLRVDHTGSYKRYRIESFQNGAIFRWVGIIWIQNHYCKIVRLYSLHDTNQRWASMPILKRLKAIPTHTNRPIPIPILGQNCALKAIPDSDLTQTDERCDSDVDLLLQNKLQCRLRFLLSFSIFKTMRFRPYLSKKSIRFWFWC